MKIISLLLAIFLMSRANAHAAPVTCAGIWAPNTSETALRRQFGARVRAEKIDVGEGETEDGTVVDTGGARSRLYVLWKDKARRRNPSSIRLRDDTRQVTYRGIGIGTTLKALERLNGRPFELAGFAFDYSGTETSWLGGRLETVGGSACEIKVRLDPRASDSTSEDQRRAAIDATIGDRPFNSSDRNMQYLDPTVYEVLLIYR